MRWKLLLFRLLPIEISEDNLIDKNHIKQISEKLKKEITSEENLKNLNKLEKEAKESVSLKWWIHRLFFGLNLSTEIEKFLVKFNPSLKIAIGTELPKKEIKSVVAAWMKFSIKRDLIYLFFVSLLPIITVVALYIQNGKLQKSIEKQDELIKIQLTATQKQTEALIIQSEEIAKQDELINKQTVQIKFQVDVETQNKKLLYLRILYDEICHTDTILPVLDQKDIDMNTCRPAYSARERSEAVKALLVLGDAKLDLRHALLQNTYLSDTNFTSVNLRKANLSGAELMRADFQGANLIDAVFDNAILAGADLQSASIQGASFVEANLISTKLQNSNLEGTKFNGADLSNANITGAQLKPNIGIMLRTDLSKVKYLTCEQLTLSLSWEETLRDQALACGASIPGPEISDYYLPH